LSTPSLPKEKVEATVAFARDTATITFMDRLPKGEYQEYLRLVCAEGPTAYPPEPAE